MKPSTSPTGVPRGINVHEPLVEYCSAIVRKSPDPVTALRSGVHCVVGPEDLRIEQSKMAHQTLDCETKFSVRLSGGLSPLGDPRYLGPTARLSYGAREFTDFRSGIVENRSNCFLKFRVKSVHKVLFAEVIPCTEAF